MPKLKPSDHVTSLKKQQADLMAKLKEAQNKAKLEAKDNQRIKNEIAGSIALGELEANPSGSFAVAFRNLLHAEITKPSIRAMFDLPPAPPNNAANQSADVSAEAHDDPQPAAPAKSPRRKKTVARYDP